MALLLCYPIALSILEAYNIPKRFSHGALALGCFSWCIMVPGAVQTTNIIPQSFLGTDAMALAVPGWIGGIFWAIGGTVILNILVTRAKKKGEVFEYGPNDKRFEVSDKLPNFWLSLVPLVFLFVIYNVFKVNINISLGLGRCSPSRSTGVPQARGHPQRSEPGRSPVHSAHGNGRARWSASPTSSPAPRPSQA